MENKSNNNLYKEPELVVGDVVNVKPESYIIKEYKNVIKGNNKLKAVCACFSIVFSASTLNDVISNISKPEKIDYGIDIAYIVLSLALLKSYNLISRINKRLKLEIESHPDYIKEM